MKKLLTLAVVGLFLTLMALVSVVSREPRTARGSIGADPYQATTTDANWNSGTCKMVRTGAGTLGSVIVTLTSNAPLAFHDATTTGPHSNHATTTIAEFKTTTAGTYTFDVAFTRGLCVVGVSTVGVASTTITSK